MSYPESVRFLYALGNELKAGAKFGLERMQTLLAALGNPERDLKIIHVAGTNGKGSTCAMIAAACQAAGLRTGLYTSPHLVSPTERIRLNGNAVSEAEFAKLFERVHEEAEQIVQRGEIDAHPSYFETVTAMAFEHFRGSTDVAVLEVGLGGRLDATNVVDPRLAVITHVDFDHESFLGRTLAAIASEKAGIIKPDRPVIVGRQHPEAEEVILAYVAELRALPIRASDYVPGKVQSDASGSSFQFLGQQFRCPLPGAHQVDNAILAILACREFGLRLDAIAGGLAQTKWPGRLEVVTRRPDFILDGAHNPSGARALASYIREFYGDRPVWLVYGAMRDKAVEEVSQLLFPLASNLILTAPDFPRAVRPETILEMAGHPNAKIAPTIPDAIELSSHAPENAVVFFTGSLFVVGEVRSILLPEAQTPVV
jgi:dihydrofolate synthase/folylpolyglutamate synthase